MISVEQIQAARALLSWTQKDLAKASKISLNTINNIERRILVPRVTSINKIQKTLEEAGIEFTEGNGVKQSLEKINTKILEGKDSLFNLWQDILNDLDQGDERLLYAIDEKKFLKFEKTRFGKVMQTFAKRRIKGKILSLIGSREYPDLSSEYMWLREEDYSSVPYIVYGNKTALILWEPVLRILIIQNSNITQSYRERFFHLWNNAIKPY